MRRQYPGSAARSTARLTSSSRRVLSVERWANTSRCTSATWPGAASTTASQPVSVRPASVPRPSSDRGCGAANHGAPTGLRRGTDVTGGQSPSRREPSSAWRALGTSTPRTAPGSRRGSSCCPAAAARPGPQAARPSSRRTRPRLPSAARPATVDPGGRSPRPAGATPRHTSLVLLSAARESRRSSRWRARRDRLSTDGDRPRLPPGRTSLDLLSAEGTSRR